MLKLDKFSYSFPEKDLYNKISFTLEDDQHCAFIGTSGSGKSTLIDIIMNPDDYMYDGKLEIPSHWRIGYVSQFPQLDTEKETTVFEYIAGNFVNLENEIETICTEMETSSDIENLLEKYQVSLDLFDTIDGDNYKNNITKKLNLINLGKYKDLKVSELSGGEFKLIQVIKEMLNKPNIMIMDEPDVFLDFGNLDDLKELINSYKGMILVITHNRYLLNHCFNKIIHLENMELQEFEGSYIDYNFSLLETKIELQELAVTDTEEIERNDLIIDRLRIKAEYDSSPSRGKYLKARMKFQERLHKNRIKMPFVDIKEQSINLKTDDEIEKTIALKVNNYNVSFDEILLENVNFEIKSTDKVAIIGSNGTGKTTLMKAIFKNDDSSIEINEDIQMAYLSQLQGEILNEENTITDEFFDIGFKTYTEVIEYVADYGFEEDTIDQKISSLSGGEKNILQLAKVSATKANMLLLDEPTSHLDTYSQISLEKAIKEYNGAIIMVSHDFYSIVNSMDYVLIIEDKTVRRLSIKKFTEIVYNNHFSKNYLELEKRKKSFETKIELALKKTNFEEAKAYVGKLGRTIKELKRVN